MQDKPNFIELGSAQNIITLYRNLMVLHFKAKFPEPHNAILLWTPPPILKKWGKILTPSYNSRHRPPKNLATPYI